MKTIFILYGEMGSGKTYEGKRNSETWGPKFFDGDDVIPIDMQECVSQFKPLSKEMLDDYIKNHLAPTIVEQCSPNDDLFVAQALYRREHRQFLNDYLTAHGCKVIFDHVYCPFWRNLKQLWSRPNGFRWFCIGL
jgi:gluconate kinase